MLHLQEAYLVIVQAVQVPILLVLTLASVSFLRKNFPENNYQWENKTTLCDDVIEEKI